MTSIDDVREALQASAGVKIMILDACRDNPLAERLSRSIAAKTREIPVVQGFSPVAPDDGMLVEYSTQPNQVASDGTSRNSPFTTALLAHLKEPGLEIGTMFRHVGNHVYKATNGSQSPELSISLHSDYFLSQSESDAQAWAKAQTSDDPSLIRDFIARFPTSPYFDVAKLRLDLLDRAAKEQGLASGQHVATVTGAAMRTSTSDSGGLTATPPQATPMAPVVAAPVDPVWAPIKIANAPSSTPSASPAESDNLLRSINIELRRLGCYSGAANADWTSASVQSAVSNFVRYESLSRAPTGPSQEFLSFLKGQSVRGCVAKRCNFGEMTNAKGDCVPLAAERPKPRAVLRKEVATLPEFNQLTTQHRHAPKLEPSVEPQKNEALTSSPTPKCWVVTDPQLDYTHQKTIQNWATGLCP